MTGCAGTTNAAAIAATVALLVHPVLDLTVTL